MRIQILSVGEIKTSYIKEGEADYLGRLRHYCNVGVDFVPGEKITRNKPDQHVLEKEGEKLIGRIPSSCFVVALDRQGEAWSSEKLAEHLAGWQNHGISCVIFLIGGPLGLDQKVLERADAVLSLSNMTFVHEMVQLILLEQLYRAFTILKGEKYHK